MPRLAHIPSATRPRPLEHKLHLLQPRIQNSVWPQARHSINICRINYLINYCVGESWKCTLYLILVPGGAWFFLFKPLFCVRLTLSFFSSRHISGTNVSQSHIRNQGSEVPQEWLIPWRKLTQYGGQEPKGRTSPFPTLPKVKI